jgi:hypothetical protein
MPSEENGMRLRALLMQREADGDIHIALQDANGAEVGTVSAEIPAGPKVV